MKGRAEPRPMRQMYTLLCAWFFVTDLNSNRKRWNFWFIENSVYERNCSISVWLWPMGNESHRGLMVTPHNLFKHRENPLILSLQWFPFSLNLHSHFPGHCHPSLSPSLLLPKTCHCNMFMVFVFFIIKIWEFSELNVFVIQSPLCCFPQIPNKTVFFL